MKRDDIEKTLREAEPELRNRFGVKRIGIFGSFAKGLENEQSDIDILVEVERPMGLMTFIKIEQYLTNLLDRTVDLITPEAIKRYMKDDILKDVRYVWAEQID